MYLIHVGFSYTAAKSLHFLNNFSTHQRILIHSFDLAFRLDRSFKTINISLKTYKKLNINNSIIKDIYQDNRQRITFYFSRHLKIISVGKKKK